MRGLLLYLADGTWWRWVTCTGSAWWQHRAGGDDSGNSYQLSSEVSTHGHQRGARVSHAAPGDPRVCEDIGTILCLLHLLAVRWGHIWFLPWSLLLWLSQVRVCGLQGDKWTASVPGTFLLRGWTGEPQRWMCLSFPSNLLPKSSRPLPLLPNSQQKTQSLHFFKGTLKATISCALITQRARPARQADLRVGAGCPFLPAPWGAPACVGWGPGIMRSSHFNEARRGGGRSLLCSWDEMRV